MKSYPGISWYLQPRQRQTYFGPNEWCPLSLLERHGVHSLLEEQTCGQRKDVSSLVPGAEGGLPVEYELVAHQPHAAVDLSLEEEDFEDRLLGLSITHLSPGVCQVLRGY
jgi:hypothetical protein